MSRQSTSGVFKGFGIREYRMIRTTADLSAAQHAAVSHGGKVVSLEIRWEVSPLCKTCQRRGQILGRCPECHGNGKLAGGKAPTKGQLQKRASRTDSRALMEERRRARSDLLCPSCAQFSGPYARSRKCALCWEPK